MTSTLPATSKAKKFIRPRRNVSVTVHLSKDEKLRLDRAAFDADEGTSAFVRKLLLWKLNNED